jgi:hypothetical protein
MERPHDITLTVEAIENHDRERKRIEDLIEVFARSFADDCGEPLSENSYFAEWEPHAGRIHATFEYSDQCGGGKEYVKFPILALSDPVERNAAVEGRRADIEIAEHRKKEDALATARAERDRALARVEKLQNAVGEVSHA